MFTHIQLSVAADAGCMSFADVAFAAAGVIIARKECA